MNMPEIEETSLELRYGDNNENRILNFVTVIMHSDHNPNERSEGSITLSDALTRHGDSASYVSTPELDISASIDEKYYNDTESNAFINHVLRFAFIFCTSLLGFAIFVTSETRETTEGFIIYVRNQSQFHQEIPMVGIGFILCIVFFFIVCSLTRNRIIYHHNDNLLNQQLCKITYFCLSMAIIFYLVPRSLLFCIELLLDPSSKVFADFDIFSTKICTFCQFLGVIFTQLSIYMLDNRLIFTSSEWWIRFQLFNDILNGFGLFTLFSKIEFRYGSEINVALNAVATLNNVVLGIYPLAQLISKSCYYHRSESVQLPYSSQRIFLIRMAILALFLPNFVGFVSRVLFAYNILTGTSVPMNWLYLSYWTYSLISIIIHGLFGLLLVSSFLSSKRDADSSLEQNLSHQSIDYLDDENSAPLPQAQVCSSSSAPLVCDVSIFLDEDDESDMDSMDLSMIPQCGHVSCYRFSLVNSGTICCHDESKI